MYAYNIKSIILKAVEFKSWEKIIILAESN